MSRNFLGIFLISFAGFSQAAEMPVAWEQMPAAVDVQSTYTPPAKPQPVISTSGVVPVSYFPGQVQSTYIPSAIPVYNVGLTVGRPVAVGYNPTHQCQNCGCSQYVISGYNPNGTHNHQCSNCGCVWSH